MKLIKTKKAFDGFGDRAAVVRSPAQYALVDEDGNVRATITGESGYMVKTSWRVQSLQLDGTPRLVGYSDTLKGAESKARNLVAKIDSEVSK